MEEFVEKVNKRRARTGPTPDGIENLRTLSPSHAKVVKENGACFVEKGPIITFGAIENVLQRSWTMRECLVWNSAGKEFEKKLLDRLGNDDLPSFSNLLKEYYQFEGVEPHNAFHKKIRMPSSTFVSAYKVYSL